MKFTPKDFMYKRKGPWPQPSPAHPWGESPAVIHVPLVERFDWWVWIGSRYLLTLNMSLPYFIYGLIRPGLEEVTDADFEEMLNNSMLSKFITAELDDIDTGIFKKYLEEEKRDWFIVDLEAVKVVKTFKGIYASGSKTLMYKEGERYKVRCIYIDKTKEIFESSDGDAWELSKYYVLQGGALCATLVLHPIQHFPNDSINAISKTALPKQHLLSKLLRPHFRFTLPLENAVLNFKSSLLKEKWYMTYAPYPGGPEGLRDLLVEGYKGIKGNASYPPFSFPMGEPSIESKYGDYLRAYYKVFYKFVSTIVKDIEPGDFWVSKWADYVNKHVVDFPSSETIFEGDNLARAVTSYLFTVSVAHSVDHCSYGGLNKRKIPLRLRQEPPTKGIKMKKRSKLVNAVDLMKYYMADNLFFSPTTVTKLINAKYKFQDSSQLNAVKVFKDELRQTDLELREKGIDYMPLNKIAASIQF